MDACELGCWSFYRVSALRVIEPLKSGRSAVRSCLFFSACWTRMTSSPDYSIQGTKGPGGMPCAHYQGRSGSWHLFRGLRRPSEISAGIIISLGCRETVIVRLLDMPTLQHRLRQSQSRAALAESPPVIMLLIVRFPTLWLARSFQPTVLRASA